MAEHAGGHESGRWVGADALLDSWTYEQAHAFLLTREREGARLDYKKNFSERMTETMVAMANTDGGLIFVGVDEFPGQSRPKDWPHLPPEQDVAHTAFQFARLAVPAVPIEVLPLRDPTTKRQLVIVKVASGFATPYFERERGVVVRVGDTSVPADPAKLQELFARRENYAERRTTLGASFRANTAQTFVDERGVVLSVLLAPLVEQVRIRFDDNGIVALRRSVGEYLPDLPRRETRFSGGLRFAAEPRKGMLALVRSGEMTFVQVLRDAGTSATTDRPFIPLMSIAACLLDVLRVATTVYGNLVRTTGPLYLAVSARGIHDRDLQFLVPRDPSVQSPPRSAQPEPATHWLEDEVEFAPDDDPRDTVEQLLASLCFELGYEAYNRYLRWFVGQI